MKILSPIIGFLITFFFPQVNYVISVVILLFLPFKAIPNFLSQFIQCFYSIFSAKNCERMLCCICFSNEKSVLFQPCNHICLCTECATKLITSTAPNCPICRARITSYIDVYI
ncbi:unnamed protein product [Dracunculus medinensis]|uniref:RING-type domain-containing protein n=1 Tax=Dracunculus medinensis TaxID=318479 RepID=A0A0N4U686_DRAME|nr:unnamed protein product [Dracunculus medinensis]